MGLATLVHFELASAQMPRRSVGQSNQFRSSPYQQRISPYLDLLRADDSALSPYHSFVQPRQQMRQSLLFQAAQIHRLGQAAPTGWSNPSGQGRLPTGHGATFNNHMHYYRFPTNSSR